MNNIDRANLILALAEVVQDAEVIETILRNSGEFDSSDELTLLEKQIMKKVSAYRTHDLWPPKIEPISKVLIFDS